MTQTIILSDLHSRFEKVVKLFRMIGLMDEQGNRIPGSHVISLGDTVCLGYGKREDSFLKWLEQFVDEWLIGNHEWPVFSTHGHFSGYHDHDPETASIVWDNKDRYKVATTHGDWLLTHAGLHPNLIPGEMFGCHADELADWLNDLFSKKLVEPYTFIRELDMVGFMRGGRDPQGGIMWNDIDDLINHYKDHGGESKKYPLLPPQIVGHSSYTKAAKYDEKLWCIDTRNSCSALIMDEEGNILRHIYAEDDPSVVMET